MIRIQKSKKQNKTKTKTKALQHVIYFRSVLQALPINVFWSSQNGSKIFLTRFLYMVL